MQTAAGMVQLGACVHNKFETYALELLMGPFCQQKNGVSDHHSA